MKTATLVASTVMLFSAPVAPTTAHAVQAAPARTGTISVKPQVARPTRKCPPPAPGWVTWYPGQVAPYILYVSTDGHIYYEAPAGHTVAVKRTINPDGSVSVESVIGPLSSCDIPLPVGTPVSLPFGPR